MDTIPVVTTRNLLWTTQKGCFFHRPDVRPAEEVWSWPAIAMPLRLPITVKVACVLSPGGLFLPYHLGALASLKYYKRLGPDNIVGGSSTGAIATMVHGCGLHKQDILEPTITVSDQCEALGGAQGRLWPLLEQQMETLVGPEEFLHLQEEQEVGIVYTQDFPSRQSYLQTDFADGEDLFRAVSF
jgi:hypothetical protein